MIICKSPIVKLSKTKSLVYRAVLQSNDNDLSLAWAACWSYLSICSKGGVHLFACLSSYAGIVLRSSGRILWPVGKQSSYSHLSWERYSFLNAHIWYPHSISSCGIDKFCSSPPLSLQSRVRSDHRGTTRAYTRTPGGHESDENSSTLKCCGEGLCTLLALLDFHVTEFKLPCLSRRCHLEPANDGENSQVEGVIGLHNLNAFDKLDGCTR